jgi:hypothetical protein
VKNRQVPRAEWHRFFDGFNRRHRGSIASVAVLSPGYGAQTEIKALPLDGVVADPAGRSLSVLLGGAAAHLDHPIDEPTSVWVELDESGAELALEIESSRGTRTILQFVADAPSGASILVAEGERP